MATASLSASKPALRRHFRQARQALNAETQRRAAEQLLTKLLEIGALQNHKHVAMYLHQDGEISCDAIITWCWENNISTALPVLDPQRPGHLAFLPYCRSTDMVENQYQIPEPRYEPNAVIPLTQLSLILMPLVAFDLSGNRLGMGGGFYDRTLSTKIAPSSEPTGDYPLLCGVAHDCQQAPQIDTETWDVPLDKIITPSHVISIAR